jgi:hypothetical protein
MSDILNLCGYEMRLQMASKRVWLGYMVGIVMIMKQAFGYVQYGKAISEPINVLEPYVVAGNCNRTILFLAVGWLLVMSEAPFMNRNSFFAIYRTKRRFWNMAMIAYIFFQAILYNGVLAVVTMIMGCSEGYFANIWSYPFTVLVNNGDKAAEYDVTFPSMDFANVETAFKGFGHTFLLEILYMVSLGLFLYVISLLFNQVMGPVAAFIFHFLGYEIMQEGYGITINGSLLARTIPAYQVGKGALVGLLQSYLIFVLLIIVLVEWSQKAIRHVDFKTVSTEEDG